MSVVLSFLIVLNILLWLLFLRNFKKLFTTDDVIEKAKSEINRIVIDLNANAERNISLIDDRMNRLRALVADAEKKIKLLDDTIAKNNALSGFRAKVEQSAEANAAFSNAAARYAAETYSRNAIAAQNKAASSAAVMLPQEAAAREQNTLFDESVSTPPENTFAAPETFSSAEGARGYSNSAAELPHISVSETPFNRPAKPDLKDSIVSLFDINYSIEEIAAKLNCSTTEVTFALSLENRI
ncbi:MAG: hypothetical protein ACTTKL_00560 [Treponema sp.]